MKRKILTLSGLFAAIVATGLITFSCSTDDNYNTIYDYYLSIAAGSAMDSPENADIIGEAIRRMEPYVSYRDGQFRSSGATTAKLHMSEELFAMMQSTMQRTNEMLREMSGEGNRLVEVKKGVVRVVDKHAALMPLRTRGLGEDPLPPGSDGWDARWYGIDIYVSPSTLHDIRIGANLGTIVSGFVAAITKVNVYVGAGITAAEALISLLADWAVTDCPNGVVVPMLWTGGVWYFDIRCQ